MTAALHNLLTALANSPKASWLSEIASELHTEFSKSKLGRAYHIIGGNSLVLVGTPPHTENSYAEPTASATRTMRRRPAFRTGMGNLSDLPNIFPASRCSLGVMPWGADCRMT